MHQGQSKTRTMIKVTLNFDANSPPVFAKPQTKTSPGRALPSEWLKVNDTSTTGSVTSTDYPLVHSAEVSTWLPELRTLSLSDNNITMTVYRALQSVIGMVSLQTLDLSNNALSGVLKGSFEQHYCGEGVSGGGSSNRYSNCDSVSVTIGASMLAILLLSSNDVEGELEDNEDNDITLPVSLSVLTVSDNSLYGSVPEGFSQLYVFFAGKIS